MARSIRPILIALLALAGVAAYSAAPHGRAAADHSPPYVPRVVAIGDIHGDLDAFIRILQRTSLVDAQLKWSGGNAILVQTGDMIDRGPKSRGVMDLLMTLQKDAPRQGGRVIVLLGNHEAMNVYGDLGYVTAADYASFADAESEHRRLSAYATYAAVQGKSAISSTDWMAAHPQGFVEQRDAFGPDGKYGKWLRSLPAVARVNDSIFAHGGISPAWASKSIDTMNETITGEFKAFDGYKRSLIQQSLARPFYAEDELMAAAKVAMSKHLDSVMGLLTFDGWLSMRDDGPLWFRGYAEWSDTEGAPQMAQLIKSVGAARVVVGHTPSQSREILSRFGGAVYLIDTGMLSSYFTGGRASALNIQGDVVTTIYATAASTRDRSGFTRPASVSSALRTAPELQAFR
jgi:hypothetical protein